MLPLRRDHAPSALTLDGHLGAVHQRLLRSQREPRDSEYILSEKFTSFRGDLSTRVITTREASGQV